jgi:hypothetical protein
MPLFSPEASQFFFFEESVFSAIGKGEKIIFSSLTLFAIKGKSFPSELRNNIRSFVVLYDFFSI